MSLPAVVRRYRAVFAMLLPAFAWAGAASAADAPCRLIRAESIDLETTASGVVTISVTIENKPARLLIDTGAAFSVLNSSFARSLGHEPHMIPNGIYFTMIGGYKLRNMVTVDSLTVGRLTAKKFQFVSTPPEAMGEDAAGVLGADVLGAYDVEIDFLAGKFNIFSQNRCDGNVVYWTQEPFAEVPITLGSDEHITIPVTLDGKEFTAIADTGAYRSFMSYEVAKSIFGIDETNPALKKIGNRMINGVVQTTTYAYPFQTLTFEGVTVRFPDIEIATEDVRTYNEPRLLIGVNVLRQLHMYIAYSDHKLYLTPAEAH